MSKNNSGIENVRDILVISFEFTTYTHTQQEDTKKINNPVWINRKPKPFLIEHTLNRQLYNGYCTIILYRI